MAHATTITLAEFVAVLSKSGWVQATGFTERVFEFPIKSYPGVVIRVYTSISSGAQVTRSVGSDAIRVCAVDTVSSRGVVKAARVHRVSGWRANLEARILETWNQARTRMAWREHYGEWVRPVAVSA